MITTKKAAQTLGISPRRVLALIKSGRLPAAKVGRDWVIKKYDLKLVSSRKPGRPPKVG
uniref:Putative DNA binding, helix-turn-helix domain containing protein n=1 Tax=viral metagenome TaxID=1070528 RepID=A0A6H1ZFV7_9ZZZZ